MSFPTNKTVFTHQMCIFKIPKSCGIQFPTRVFLYTAYSVQFFTFWPATLSEDSRIRTLVDLLTTGFPTAVRFEHTPMRNCMLCIGTRKLGCVRKWLKSITCDSRYSVLNFFFDFCLRTTLFWPIYSRPCLVGVLLGGGKSLSQQHRPSKRPM